MTGFRSLLYSTLVHKMEKEELVRSVQSHCRSFFFYLNLKAQC